MTPLKSPEPHVPRWEWVYAAVERLDFVITAHDTTCPRDDEIYCISSDFPKAVKLYYRDGEEMLPVIYIPAPDRPMSRFDAYRDEGGYRVVVQTRLWSEIGAMSTEALRQKFLLVAQVDVAEDVSALAFDDERGYAYTRKLVLVEDFSRYFMKGLTALRQKHRDLVLTVT